MKRPLPSFSLFFLYIYIPYLPDWQVAKIETEKLLAATVQNELQNRRANGSLSSQLTCICEKFYRLDLGVTWELVFKESGNFSQPRYKGNFSPQFHAFGYEGRAGLQGALYGLSSD